jgi:hypothetical protein
MTKGILSVIVRTDVIIGYHAPARKRYKNPSGERSSFFTQLSLNLHSWHPQETHESSSTRFPKVIYLSKIRERLRVDRIMITGYPEPGKATVYEDSPTIDIDNVDLNGGYLLKTLVLSIDPYMRGRMRPAEVESYVVSRSSSAFVVFSAALKPFQPAFDLKKP